MASPESAPSAFEARVTTAHAACGRLMNAIAEVIVGQDEVVAEVMWGLLAGGHVLLEGNPGLGKTLLVRTLASCLDLGFSRIQFTPDLMPSDVTGTNVLSLGTDGGATGRFELHRGPIFGQVVLADEINRATPKTQSALLEAMQEHAVTIAGTRHVLTEPFFVLATQNPIEREIPVAEPVLKYAARLVAASDPGSSKASELVRRSVRYGAGVRGGQALVLAGKAIALLEGRPQVSFDDIRRAAAPVLRHRILRSFEGEADGVTTDRIVSELTQSVETLPDNVAEAVQAG
jgi:MoxR-like ATPase